MSTVDIAYGAARRSQYLNRRFDGVISAGPKRGFNVRKLTGFIVQISQIDDVGADQALVTPEGVVIREVTGWTTQGTIPSDAGTYLVVCRYTYGAGAADPSYLAVVSGVELATDTILATVVVDGGELSLIESNIKEPVRERSGGAIFPISAVKDERRPCLGQVSFPCAIMQNFDPAGFAAGFHYDFAAGADTAFVTDACVPPGLSDVVGPYARVRIWYSLRSFVANGTFTGRVTWSIAPAASGDPPVSNFKEIDETISGGATGQWRYVDVVLPGTGAIAGVPLQIVVSRDSTDTMNATVRMESIELYYERSKIGTLLEDW